MEAIKNFDAFYSVKLQPHLARLKRKDRVTFWWGVATAVLGLAIVPVLAFGLGDAWPGYGGWIIITTIVLAVVSTYQYTKEKEAYAADFKKQVIQQIIEFIHPGLVYKPDICINHIDYENSALCRAWYDDYDGEDWIGGTYKNINFKCSELQVTRRSGSSSSSYSVFRGLFFVAPLPVSFTGGTYVWLKNNIQLPASIAEERYRMQPMPEVVRVDLRNGEFEKQYVVYTTDVSEASTIITAEMMTAIINFKKQIAREISISFVAGVCYVAIPFSETLFEPEPGNPVDKEAIKEYFFSVLLVLSIINQLKLHEF